ncbi:telomere-associated protein 1 [Fulvia fulva]|uniref:Telomere-associated protein 1 n=1 Tax=Passalora fulva TaxID=5499 RepID=A0A9Q8PLX9_PASFU|nr:telomere-associated protein 1 [Fulvia fulva]KAK4609427.1 telomere-associated protein 1 [Fulvia fulva]KAK4609616.1 telomere-associated protein 1 [Fulvia fulva]UJO24960.1 telomere-associated protein 1 [Fulvia fulva]WPV22868.1 telomere-associated protein 1 [Fulvia fulva]WPV37613.1 telomere-associated protein 1 [Fulvia fulva]
MSRTDNASAYRPTSLDFINLPNPIEPDGSGSQKHPLNGTPRLEKARLDSASNQDLFKLILDRNDERPPKRQKPSDTALLDLPRLPVRNPAKRLRIPPTLSGLHQPPPDAGLLPSISVEQPQVLPPRHSDQVVHDNREKAVEKTNSTSAPSQKNESAKTSSQPSKQKQKRGKRNKWSDEETEDLLKGVARFGIGNWTKILKCPDYDFHLRTALDLKDRFRVCRPDDYRSTKDQPATERSVIVKGPVPERVSDDKLAKLGITEAFGKKAGRSGYTDAEDDALFRGFEKYGHQWAKIRSDSSFGLTSRKPADLRDHFRARFPDEYSKGGRSSRPSKSAASSDPTADVDPKRTPSQDSDRQPEASKSANEPTVVASKDETYTLKTSFSKKPHQPSLFALDDVFLNTPFDIADDDGENIVLDRGILDWATDVTRPPAPDLLKNSGIDPRMTLMLPKPVSNVPPAASLPPTSNHATNLPSLSGLMPDTVNPNQLELPSLTKWYESGGHEGRLGGGVTIPALEELLGTLNNA